MDSLSHAHCLDQVKGHDQSEDGSGRIHHVQVEQRQRRRRSGREGAPVREVLVGGKDWWPGEIRMRLSVSISTGLPPGKRLSRSEIHECETRPFLCALFRRRRAPLSRTYGVRLPSSFTTVLSSALGYSPHPPVSVLVRDMFRHRCFSRNSLCSHRPQGPAHPTGP